ncbi:hypothetical protein RDT67_18810 [Serratia fonticola]|uniref:Uncharacterized protein n=1 Tax=Serratia fonticola TaxID=47917 RepID=A0AAJ2DC79_SERFO|nr:hypothetical protein [Serratia fonticola]MDQ9128471.1 hypothetical protein [Serratia fonticola]
MSILTIVLVLLIVIQWFTIVRLNRSNRLQRAETNRLAERYGALIKEHEELLSVLSKPFGGVLKRYFESQELLQKLSGMSEVKIREAAVFLVETLEIHLLRIIRKTSHRYSAAELILVKDDLARRRDEYKSGERGYYIE